MSSLFISANGLFASVSLMIYVVVLNKVFFIRISYKEHAQWSLTWMCLPSHLVEDFSWCTRIIHPWLIHESLLPTHGEWERLWNNVEFIWSHMKHFLFEFPAWIPSFVMSTKNPCFTCSLALIPPKTQTRFQLPMDFHLILLLEKLISLPQKTEEQWNLKECCWWPNWRRKGEKK